jgi:hypothetical protein
MPCSIRVRGRKGGGILGGGGGRILGAGRLLLLRRRSANVLARRVAQSTLDVKLILIKSCQHFSLYPVEYPNGVYGGSLFVVIYTV